MEEENEQLSRRELDELIISAVQHFPCLYDPSYKEYRDVVRTSTAWDEAAKLCGKMEVGHCKERWRKLRDAYVKVNKKLTRHGAGMARQHTNWPYYDMMSFLEDYIKHRKKSPPSAGGKRHKPVKIEYQVETNPIHIISNEHESSGSSLLPKRMAWAEEPGTPKAKKACRPVDTIEMALLESLGQSSKIQPDVTIDDEEGLFGKMVAATLRRFPPRAKALCKFRIQEIIFEQENQNLNSNSP